MVAVALLIAIVAACADYGPIANLQAMPEATLYLPGSTVIREWTNPRTGGIDGGGPATVGHNLATNATPDDVMSFYVGELGAEGWTAGSPVMGGPVGAQHALWTKGEAVFQLSIYSSDSDAVAAKWAKEAGYATGYTVTIQDDPRPTPSR